MPSKIADGHLRSAVRLPLPLYGEGTSEFLSVIRSEFHLGKAGSLEIVDHAFEDGNTLLFLRFTQDAILRGADLGVADGIAVEVGGTLTLHFDSKGEITSFDLEETSEKDLEAERREIVMMVQGGMVHLASRNEVVNPQKLVENGKTLYIQEDRMGILRPHRIIID